MKFVKPFRTVAALFLAVVLMLGTLSGCQSAETPESGGTTTAAGTASTTTAPAPVSVNPLTGKNDMNGSTSDRPVGIMIANNDFIQDAQVGIADADMWMEAETEAGITRIMAVFANSSRIPSSIGPIRSARSPFVHVAEALGFAYVHAGGSLPALSNISSADIADINLDTEEGADYSWRDEEYYQYHDYEFCLRTGGKEMTDYIADHNYSTAAVRSVPWTFGGQTGSKATTVDIRMSDAQLIQFEYNEESGLYDKYNGYDEIRHCDINGTPIQTENILVLYTDKFWETEETIDFYLQSGTGYVFSQGKTRQFEWTRSGDGFIMTEQNGDKLALSEGRVYLCVVSSEYEGSLSYGGSED